MNKERIVQTKTPLIGKNMKRLRELAGLKNIELVTLIQLKGIDISRGTYSKIETGVNNPSVELLVVLTEILNCDFNEFFKCESQQKN